MNDCELCVDSAGEVVRQLVRAALPWAWGSLLVGLVVVAVVAIVQRRRRPPWGLLPGCAGRWTCELCGGCVLCVCDCPYGVGVVRPSALELPRGPHDESDIR